MPTTAEMPDVPVSKVSVATESVSLNVDYFSRIGYRSCIIQGLGQF
jgi:hypothetical protein